GLCRQSESCPDFSPRNLEASRAIPNLAFGVENRDKQIRFFECVRNGSNCPRRDLSRLRVDVRPNWISKHRLLINSRGWSAHCRVGIFPVRSCTRQRYWALGGSPFLLKCVRQVNLLNRQEMLKRRNRSEDDHCKYECREESWCQGRKDDSDRQRSANMEGHGHRHRLWHESLRDGSGARRSYPSPQSSVRRGFLRYLRIR